MPIYQVSAELSPNVFDVRIIDAKTKSQAVNYATRKGVEVKVLTASEVVKLIQSGSIVETATPEVTETPAEPEVVAEPTSDETLSPIAITNY